VKIGLKNIHLLNLILILLIVGVLAKLAADIVAYRLSHIYLKTPLKASVSPAPVANEDLASFSPILEKGLFGKATQGKLTSLNLFVDSRSSTAANQKDLILLGTARGSSKETFALIQKQSTREEKVFRLNDQVFDLGRLITVKKELVEIQSGGIKFKLFSPTAVPTEGDKATALPFPSSGPLALQVGAGSYVVDQRALHSALDNLEQTMTSARLLPNLKEGKVEGFKVSEVRPAGLFGLMGVKNGDVLLKVNDFSIDSPEKAVQSFSSLKGLNRVRLDLLREGQPATFIYDIR
jgi:general secretion pathway protein C